MLNLLKTNQLAINPLRLTNDNGKEVTYERGIGAHATSTITYDLTDKDFAYFTSYVGIDRQMFGIVGPVSFEVYVDGDKKFDSGLMNSKDSQKYVEVDINGAKELKLVVTDGENGIGSDHASWGDTKLHFVNPNTQTPSEDSEAKKKLKNLVEYASSITKDMIGASNHIEQRWNNFSNQLEVAKSLLQNSDASDEDFNNCFIMLNYFIEELYISK